MFDLDQTIAAPATPPGAALRGILRVSGPNVREELLAGFHPDDPEAWNSATRPEIHAGTFSLEENLDYPVTVGLWPTSRSYTGQPMAEIYTLGSQPLLERMLSRLNEAGIRTARQGEFTLRAFLSGRIDLVQAEAVLGVIDSRDEHELETALNQLGGGLSNRMLNVRRDLLELLSDLEAGLDFVEEDIEFVPHADVVRRLHDAEEAVAALLLLSHSRLRSETRAKVVLAGLPNAGKSTLLNRLAGQEAAIVSEISGTTRDYLAVECEVHGQPVLIVDTAGWDVSGDPIMQKAQQFREEQIRQADLVVWCSPYGLADEESQLDAEQRESCQTQSHAFVLLHTKCDLAEEAENTRGELSISSLRVGTGELDALLDRIAEELGSGDTGEGGMIGTTSARCAETLRDTQSALARAREAAESSLGDELVAMELRVALDGLGQVLGLIHTDDILDRIFSKFCIGK